MRMSVSAVWMCEGVTEESRNEIIKRHLANSTSTKTQQCDGVVCNNMYPFDKNVQVRMVVTRSPDQKRSRTKKGEGRGVSIRGEARTMKGERMDAWWMGTNNRM